MRQSNLVKGDAELTPTQSREVTKRNQGIMDDVKGK